MKRLLVCFICVLFLTGCSGENGIDHTLQLRQQLLSAKECSFTADIMADYGDSLYTFSVQCLFDELGNMTFTVIAPESICGVAGKIEDEQGFLTFDDQAVAFPLLTDAQLTPISAPWIFMKALRSGYINSSASDGALTYVCIDDSFKDDAMQVDFWLDQFNAPVRAEILYKNCRILSLTITEFTYV